MKTIDELAQVLLTVDSKLDLSLLNDERSGLLVDDDLHRELYAAIDDALVEGDGVHEFLLDEGGGFQIANEEYDLVYSYNPDGGVIWWYQEA